MLTGLDKEGKACCFLPLQLHLLQSETYFSLEHCAKEMISFFFVIRQCRNFSKSNYWETALNGRKGTTTFTVYISSEGPSESFEARIGTSYCL